MTFHNPTTNPESVTLYRKDGRRKRGAAPEQATKCAACRGEFRQSVWGRKNTFCESCKSEYARAQRRAVQAVGKAVARGLIPPARELDCIDCKVRWGIARQAAHYDHRSYKPADRLKVEAVCAMHNFDRGRAKWAKPRKKPPQIPHAHQDQSSPTLPTRLSSAYRTDSEIGVGACPKGVR